MTSHPPPDARADLEMRLRDQDLLQQVGVILWRADARTFQTTFVSKEAEAFLGYPVHMWLEVPGFWLNHVHPDDREWVVALSGKATQELRKHDFEYRMITADGQTIWLRNIVNVVAVHGQPSELIGVTTNIDARKRAEFEVERLRHELAHAGRVTVLGELAATLAHELNQPLGAIVSNAETAQVLLNREPLDRDELGGILRDIAQDGQRAGAVIHRVRRLLQKQLAEVQPLDLGRLVDEVVRLTRGLAASRRIEIITDVPAGLPASCGDAVQVEQVLLNLLTNAIDAVADRPEGQRRVSVRVVPHGTGVEIVVSDTGTGIPAEILPHVFDPFFTTKRSGIGMGLSICRTIVRAHGGEIVVDNNAGGGATVRFTLPPYVAPERRA